MARPGWFALGASLASAALAAAPGCGSKGATDQPQTDAPEHDPPGRPGIPFGTQGPWAVENRTYGGADGIQEGPVVAATTDEAENRWVATPRALYVLRPGDRSFRRYDEHDGLHLGEMTGLAPGPVGWAKYCGHRPVPADTACRPDEETLWGGASAPGILSLAGGAAGEVFVGYAGTHDEYTNASPAPVCPTPDDPTGGNGEDLCDPARHSGKVDRVQLHGDGTVRVDRFDFFANAQGFHYWHDRVVYRLAYDHFAHPGTLYAGTEHGVNLFFTDRFAPFTGTDLGALAAWIDGWSGDHLHAFVCYHAPCSTGASLRLGGWEGLAVAADGQLWHAGKWGAGRISWDPDPVHWVQRNGGAYTLGFGDPYPTAPNDEGFQNEPVFKVAAEGDDVNLSAAAVCPDGRAWFASHGPQSGTTHTVGVWQGHRFDTWNATALGLARNAVQDLACLPDGRVVLAGRGSGLVLYDPATGVSKAIHAGQGIPSDDVLRIEVDRMTNPATLNVATAGGAAFLRVFP